MSGNAYARVRRLSSHPAFSYSGTDAAPLRCRLCPSESPHFFGRIPEYDRHFMTHKPTREEAAQWLSWHSFERLFPEEIKQGEDLNSPLPKEK